MQHTVNTQVYGPTVNRKCITSSSDLELVAMQTGGVLVIPGLYKKPIKKEHYDGSYKRKDTS